MNKYPSRGDLVAGIELKMVIDNSSIVIMFTGNCKCWSVDLQSILSDGSNRKGHVDVANRIHGIGFKWNWTKEVYILSCTGTEEKSVKNRFIRCITDNLMDISSWDQNESAVAKQRSPPSARTCRRARDCVLYISCY